ncbi:MAG: CehA/McbA family metallohydrolase [Planctomycetaceae bacterium]
MLRSSIKSSLFACVMATALWGGGVPPQAAEIVTITPAVVTATGTAGPPAGKEADWILGDHLLRNDRIVAVIAAPGPTRHANMTVKNVGGCIIDLTEVTAPNDQLSAFYPADGAAAFEFIGTAVEEPVGPTLNTVTDGMRTLSVRGRQVTFRVASRPAPGKPRVDVVYTLADGEDFVTVTTTFANPHAEELAIEPSDRIRADRTFTSGMDPATDLVWWNDEWFGQAYGIVPDKAALVPGKDGDAAARASRDPVRYALEGSPQVTVPPGGSVELVRRVFPARHLLAACAIATRLKGLTLVPASILVSDARGPVANALVTIFNGDATHGDGRTGADGRLETDLPATGNTWRAVAKTAGRGTSQVTFDPVRSERLDVTVSLPEPGFVVGRITSESGGPIPCKVQFRARAAANAPSPPADPDFGPDSGHTAVKNLVYSHDGAFRQEVPPGDYDVIVSLGPEYDAVFTTLSVERGREVPLEAVLRRSVDTSGWISSDFHSHATESGDNTTSQFGRVQNLLSEHIEFAPCTEHNRISSYAPHLERLRAGHLMATCTGMELTGSLLPVNHQNAFPLVERRHTQDGGGPAVRDDDPLAQIERLALWDGGSDKVVQMNHPHLVQVLGDRDTDGTADAGFEGMFGFVDVIEVHPPHEVFLAPRPGADPPPGLRDDPRKKTSTMFVWLQMLNLGYRVPGVVNTDAHYTFHGSGWLRNWIASPTDDPAKVSVSDVVKATESGRIVMSNGPFLEARVTVQAAGRATEAGPGDAVADDDGVVALAIRVQCPNWLDVDRVQVFVNGRAEPTLDMTRRSRPELFSRDPLRFAHMCEVRVDRDAHLVVAAIGEESSLGPVMGPEHAGSRPVAVANPIFVDRGGDGFTANGDLLGLPIPHQPRPTHRRHVHDHAHPHGHE